MKIGDFDFPDGLLFHPEQQVWLRRVAAPGTDRGAPASAVTGAGTDAAIAAALEAAAVAASASDRNATLPRLRLGITAFGVHQAGGEVFMCRPKPVGTRVEAGRSIAVVEVAKAIVSVPCPLHGVVLAINPLLAATPELVHRDPYGEGWLAELQPIDPAHWQQDAAALVHGAAVQAAMAHQLWLFREQGGEPA